MKRALAALAALLSLSASAPQEKSIAWTKTWAEALEEASIRNVPIYFTVHQDGCKECMSIEKTASWLDVVKSTPSVAAEAGPRSVSKL